MPIFDFNSNASTIKELIKRVNTETLQHEGNGDPKWAEMQVQMLASAVAKPKYLESLLKAIVEEEPNTPCCPASTKRPLGPEVYLFSMKLFRFSFVRSMTRLKYAAHCKYQPQQAPEVCINPWHYDLVKPTTGIPPIIIDSSLIQQNAPIPQRIMDHCYLNLRDLRGRGPPTAYISGDEMTEHIDNAVAGIPPQMPADFFIPDANAPTRNQFLPNHMSPSTSCPSSGPNSPHSFLSSDGKLSDDEDDLGEVMDADTSDPPIQRLIDALPPELQGSLQLPARGTKVEVPYSEPESWLSVTYYERMRRIGAPVDLKSPYVTIDGYTHPYTSSRVSLAYFSNSSRDLGVSRALLHMGRGLRLYYIGGEVFLECLSSQPIYVQSPNCNQRHGWHAATVVQISIGAVVKIFSYAEFASQLSEAVKYGFDCVYAVARLCTIRVSFVKGWGSAFKNQQVTNSPIWIEAHLNGALEWVDNVLMKMGCPSRVCTSFS